MDSYQISIHCKFDLILINDNCDLIPDFSN